MHFTNSDPISLLESNSLKVAASELTESAQAARLILKYCIESEPTGFRIWFRRKEIHIAKSENEMFLSLL
jgi:hypothetical protein